MTARYMIERINSSTTLTQEELFPLFSRATFLVNDSVRLLIQENSYIPLSIVSLAVEVAANLDRNKAIYRRPIDFVECEVLDVPVDADKRKSDLLCSCMDLQLALASGNKDLQAEIIFSIPLTRMVLEKFVRDWYSKASSYEDLALKSVESYIDGDPLWTSSLDLVMFRIENECGISTFNGYGVVRYIGRRIKSLQKIYDRVFTAYGRVILKLAKTQAVSEDAVLDNMQNGSFGLLRAISSYDNVSNARFVGHARWWIRQSMLYYIKEDSNLIRVSSNTWQHYAKLEALRQQEESKRGHLSTSQLSELSGYSQAHVESIYNTVRTSQVRSLDYPSHPNGDDSSPTLQIADPNKTTDPADFTTKDTVRTLLESLPDDLRNLVCLVYGLTEHLAINLSPEMVDQERLKQMSATL